MNEDINQSSIIVGNAKNGKGIFAGKNFKRGEKIAEVKGDLLTEKEYDNLITEQEKDHSLQISKKLYLFPKIGDPLDFINHSCAPNAGVLITNNEAILIAIKDIYPKDEITFDYSTTMDEDYFELNCNCGSQNCKGRIRDFKYLPDNIKEKYAELGIVPEYNLQYVQKTITTN